MSATSSDYSRIASNHTTLISHLKEQHNELRSNIQIIMRRLEIGDQNSTNLNQELALLQESMRKVEGQYHQIMSQNSSRNRPASPSNDLEENKESKETDSAQPRPVSAHPVFRPQPAPAPSSLQGRARISHGDHPRFVQAGNQRSFPVSMIQRRNVVLSDGFVFATYDPVMNPIPSWRKDDPILVAQNGGPMDAFRLFNLKAKNHAGARFDHFSEFARGDSRTIDRIEETHVTLSDGSTYEVDPKDLEILSQWSPDEVICLSNNKKYSSLPGLLINADRDGEFVHLVN